MTMRQMACPRSASKPLSSGLLTLVLIRLCSASIAESEDAEMLERLKLSQPEHPQNYWPEIDQKLQAKDYQRADALATAALAEPISLENRELDAWKRSEAYRLRALAREGEKQPLSAIYADEVEAANLGNLQAVRSLSQKYLDYARQSPPGDVQFPDGTAASAVLRVGFDLGETVALQAVAQGTIGAAFSKSERDVAEALSVLKSDGDKLGALALDPTIDKSLQESSIVGGSIAASHGVPARGIIATIFAESALRQQLASELGVSQRKNRPARELSLREILELDGWAFDRLGLITSYILIPEDGTLGSRSIVLPKKTIADSIGPGDVVYVRCGSLAHAAWVFSVDRRRDEMVVMDGLFQYWQPSHNACITQFSQFHYKYGYFHTRLRFSEVTQILDAVETFRDRRLPPFVDWMPGQSTATHGIHGQIAQSCMTTDLREGGLLGASIANGYVSGSDLFSFGEYESASLDSHLDRRLYLPNRPSFRGNAIVALHTDAGGCIRAASLFVRQLFMRDELEAGDLIRGFLKQALSSMELGQLHFAAQEVSSGSASMSPGEEFAKVLDGKRDQVALVGGMVEISAANVSSDTGAAWVRLDVRETVTPH